MSTPPVQEMTPPQQPEELNPLQLEGVTPQQMEEMVRHLVRAFYTPRTDELTSLPVEEMAIATTSEATPETLDSLMSTLNKWRIAIALTSGLGAVVSSEIFVKRIPKGLSITLAVACRVLTINRVLGISASNRRKDPPKNYHWSMYSAVASTAVYGVAGWYLSRKQHPTVFVCLVMLMFTAISGMSSLKMWVFAFLSLYMFTFIYIYDTHVLFVTKTCQIILIPTS